MKNVHARKILNERFRNFFNSKYLLKISARKDFYGECNSYEHQVQGAFPLHPTKGCVPWIVHPGAGYYCHGLQESLCQGHFGHLTKMSQKFGYLNQQ